MPPAHPLLPWLALSPLLSSLLPAPTTFPVATPRPAPLFGNGPEKSTRPPGDTSLGDLSGSRDLHGDVDSLQSAVTVSHVSSHLIFIWDSFLRLADVGKKTQHLKSWKVRSLEGLSMEQGF